MPLSRSDCHITAYRWYGDGRLFLLSAAGWSESLSWVRNHEPGFTNPSSQKSYQLGSVSANAATPSTATSRRSSCAPRLLRAVYNEGPIRSDVIPLWSALGARPCDRNRPVESQPVIQILLLVVFIAACVGLVAGSAKTRAPMGWLLLIVGVSVFAIRLRHEGPYAIPRDGNLRAAVLALAMGAGLVRTWMGSDRRAQFLIRIALAISPIVLFFSLYSTLAELEEVVVLRATLDSGDTRDLRLWIVDSEGTPWVTMPRSKADANELENTQAQLLRRGELHCVNAVRVDEQATVNEIHQLRFEKYAVQRLATQIGIFAPTAGENVVALRLDACPEG